MGLLSGKRLLVTGVLTEASIAFDVARLAQEEGADVVLSSFGRAFRLTERIAGRLPKPAPVIELDVTSSADLEALPARVREHLDGLDGVVHAIGFAPEAAFDFLNTAWTLQIIRGVLIWLVGLLLAGALALGQSVNLFRAGTAYADPLLPWLLSVSTFGTVTVFSFEPTVTSGVVTSYFGSCTSADCFFSTSYFGACTWPSCVFLTSQAERPSTPAATIAAVIRFLYM